MVAYSPPTTLLPLSRSPYEGHTVTVVTETALWYCRPTDFSYNLA